VLRPNRAAIIFFDDGSDRQAIKLVESVGVRLRASREQRRRIGRVDFSGSADFGEVADAAEAGGWRCEVYRGPHGNLGSAASRSMGTPKTSAERSTTQAQLVVGVELQRSRMPKRERKGEGQQPGTRRCRDERERVNAMTCVRPRAGGRLLCRMIH